MLPDDDDRARLSASASDSTHTSEETATTSHVVVSDQPQTGSPRPLASLPLAIPLTTVLPTSPPTSSAASTSKQRTFSSSSTRPVMSPHPHVPLGAVSTPAKGLRSGNQSPISMRSVGNESASSIFERDVEFSDSHLLTQQEASDLAVPSVLSEAALVLTDDRLDAVQIESIIREPSSSDLLSQNLASTSLSPATARSKVAVLAQEAHVPTLPPPLWTTMPANTGLDRRAVSPDLPSPTSSTVLTPGTSPSSGGATRLSLSSSDPYMGFRERKQRSSGAQANAMPTMETWAGAGHQDGFVSPFSSAPNSPRSFRSLSPAVIDRKPQPVLVAANHLETLADPEEKPRRLSFLTYADIINSERLDSAAATQRPQIDNIEALLAGSEPRT
ncbi:uncharacterized protein L969DRAFT_52851 [Mixia osmundae IAM 14324]|uniref:Uncharacterized protein n=1 Tax=Mixia osmundae (strain CBS 9802 / IAM 14324 / JCM 22182 / KY 12970) TaxID=764103 RepID=G7E4W0_MIXOS|nr:uncharacterized protein L969DRAFT_52851 [Mixia osmundae IAM 14324]KEI37733.1 hypothetical protein L969DRAFT_52851 [Mixia osmundae IAM 14324]GAA97870.1 hypothetical protein E5Q_04550 [Mixia osmundae IAM 14324]